MEDGGKRDLVVHSRPMPGGEEYGNMMKDTSKCLRNMIENKQHNYDGEISTANKFIYWTQF